MKVIASEQSFRLPLLNPETGQPTPLWDVAGKIDGIIEMDGRKLVIEHKFIADSLEQDGDYWRRLQLDAQITIYTWAARQLGHDVSGVLYDAIRKPTIRPSAVPILDDDDKKVVLDADNQRVFNRVKAKKKCEQCEGSGMVLVHDSAEGVDCPCTYGAPRQTGDTAKGWVLQTRRMTVEEWSAKLMADIGERPEFYFARVEIARLDSDIDEMLAEMWDIQKTIREAQKTGRHYKTVGRDTCPFCPFFGFCTSKIDVTNGELPEGFVVLENPHPELV